MGKDDDTERRALGGKPVPARPKGSARPSGTAMLDEMLGKRAAPPKRLEFSPEQPEQPEQEFSPEHPEQPEQPEQKLNYDAFHSFRLILRTLNKYPKATQREMISLLNDLLQP